MGKMVALGVFKPQLEVLKLGIIGYGHIGTQLSIIAESIGMKVYYYDIENKLSLGNATQIATLDELLAMSDVITLHVPETASTKDMIGEAQLAKMKSGAILINAARGTVVDIPALTAAMASGHLAGAAGHRLVSDEQGFGYCAG